MQVGDEVNDGAVDEDTDAMMMGWLWVVVVTMDNGYVVIIMMMMPLIMLLIRQ